MKWPRNQLKRECPLAGARSRGVAGTCAGGGETIEGDLADGSGAEPTGLVVIGQVSCIGWCTRISACYCPAHDQHLTWRADVNGGALYTLSDTARQQQVFGCRHIELPGLELKCRVIWMRRCGPPQRVRHHEAAAFLRCTETMSPSVLCAAQERRSVTISLFKATANRAYISRTNPERAGVLYASPRAVLYSCLHPAYVHFEPYPSALVYKAALSAVISLSPQPRAAVVAAAAAPPTPRAAATPTLRLPTARR